MPGLYVIGALSSVISEKEHTNLPEGWSVLKVSHDKAEASIKKHGYLGNAFINHNSKEIVIAHRGTHFANEFKLNEIIASISNLGNDSTLASQKIPAESGLALEFSQEIVGEYNKLGYRFIQAGHSLGGFHAHLVGFLLKQPVIAFDPPGCKEQLDLLSEIEYLDEQLFQHFTFLSVKNFVNETNTQIGNVYQLPGKESSFSKSIATANAHFLEFILKKIPQNAADPTVGGATPDAFQLVQQVKNVLQEEKSKNPVVKSTFKHKSQVSADYRYDENDWVVSVLNTDDKWLGLPGHSMIVIEGIATEEDQAWAKLGENFVRMYDVQAKLFEEQKSRVNLEGYIFEVREFVIHRSEGYDSTPKRSYIIKSSKVRNFIVSIKKDQAQCQEAKEKNNLSLYPEYQLMGENSRFFSNPNAGQNCASWVDNKLLLLGINKSHPVKPKELTCLIL